jgi:hypothetical protein
MRQWASGGINEKNARMAFPLQVPEPDRRRQSRLPEPVHLRGNVCGLLGPGLLRPRISLDSGGNSRLGGVTGSGHRTHSYDSKIVAPIKMLYSDPFCPICRLADRPHDPIQRAFVEIGARTAFSEITLPRTGRRAQIVLLPAHNFAECQSRRTWLEPTCRSALVSLSHFGIN